MTWKTVVDISSGVEKFEKQKKLRLGMSYSSQLPMSPQQIVFLAGVMLYLRSYITGITAETTLYVQKGSRNVISRTPFPVDFS